ncbi:type II toxin-antitoxin system Phd/YefM family antitoxin [Moorena producens]|uniref:type II toxin-antitoxin system Phd/YefM family antitoxin n=1 Tax=Moorena producens TaxID=1155739 RepID=UPI0019310AD7|nr:hypothetical protein [Moorena producens]
MPIPDSRFPIPCSEAENYCTEQIVEKTIALTTHFRHSCRFPIPDSRFPIPDSRIRAFAHSLLPSNGYTQTVGSGSIIMQQIQLKEAETRLAELLEAAATGEEVVILGIDILTAEGRTVILDRSLGCAAVPVA